MRQIKSGYWSWPVIHLLLLTQMYAGSLLAQSGDSLYNVVKQDGFIEDMGNYIAFKVSATNDVESFQVNTPDQEIKIAPNVKTPVTLGLHYRFFSFSYSYAPKFIPGNNDDELKGKSKIFSLGFGINTDRITQFIGYNRTKGYYLANTEDFIPGWQEGIDTFIQFPDLYYTAFSGYTGYKFNTHFSIPSLSSQTERQLKSAGCFLPILLYRYYVIDDRTPLTGTNSSQKSNNIEVDLTPSYLYTFVLKQSFYVSAGAGVGAGIVHTNLITRTPGGDEKTVSNNFILRFEGRTAIGYNSKRFFAGGQLYYATESFNQEKTTAVTVNTRLNYQLFVGYRINAPGFLKKSFDWMHETLPVI